MMGIGVLATLLAPEPPGEGSAPRTLADAVILPFKEFLKRRGAIEVLAFLLLYKVDAVLTQSLMTPFFMSLGFTKTVIGDVAKAFGLIDDVLEKRPTPTIQAAAS